MFPEVFPEYGIEGLEISRVVEPDTTSHDMFWSVARFFQDRQQIPDRLVRLCHDISTNNLAIQHRHLTRYIEPPIGFDSTSKWKVLAAGSLAALDAVSLQVGI